jgi:hypothetical protein
MPQGKLMTLDEKLDTGIRAIEQRQLTVIQGSRKKVLIHL